MASEHINQDKSFQNKTNEDCINGDVQFSVGKQSETIRQQFWATIYKECLMCKSQNIAFHLWRCRCSFNGDDKQFDTSIKLTY
ncbi:unnamed protein product [Rotaria sordida]|uniref:Uncharacterized protein n=1 Tax=Rotaria sordida TaxID=392033 RepID=A0A815JCW8_9BILA|nr:unnamed protein product [Rotaria sordida]